MTFITAFISLFITLFTETADTVMLAGIDIVSSVKLSDDTDKQPYSATTLGRVGIEERHINSIKELTAIAPNFYQPDVLRPNRVLCAPRIICILSISNNSKS